MIEIYCVVVVAFALFVSKVFSSIFQIVRALFGWPFVISIIFNSFANKPKINVSFLHLFCMFLFNYIAFYRLLYASYASNVFACVRVLSVARM